MRVILSAISNQQPIMTGGPYPRSGKSSWDSRVVGGAVSEVQGPALAGSRKTEQWGEAYIIALNTCTGDFPVGTWNQHCWNQFNPPTSTGCCPRILISFTLIFLLVAYENVFIYFIILFFNVSLFWNLNSVVQLHIGWDSQPKLLTLDRFSPFWLQ